MVLSSCEMNLYPIAINVSATNLVRDLPNKESLVVTSTGRLFTKIKEAIFLFSEKGELLLLLDVEQEYRIINPMINKLTLMQILF